MLRLVLYCLLFCVAGNILVSAQVYQYVPVSYSDAEINPTIILSDKYYSRFAAQHINSFSGNTPFSVSRINFQKKLDGIFSGVGLTLTNTNQGNRTYNHVALSMAYRNVLFNSVYVRLGITAKLIQNNVGLGSFDLFQFQSQENIPFKQFSGNLNYNLAFSSSLERYYVSFSYLNHQPFYSNDTLLFPTYFLIQAGNLASLLNRNNLNHNISFAYFSKKGNDGIREDNFYVNLFYALQLNRTTTLLAGGRLGYSTAGFLHFIPSLSLNNRKAMCTLGYGFYSASNESLLLIPSFLTQINFNIPWTQKKYYSGVSF